ncbi:MAG: glycosyltransferase family 4 protein [Candidatus Rokubacteria bacterium]|nr:glycosyltransferase family 4 protein [Candidatus Rokubacteria bacterium]
MRFVILAKSTLAHQSGGHEINLSHLCAGLSARRHEIAVVTTAHPDGVRREQAGGVDVHYVDAPGGRYSRAWWEESARSVRTLHARAPVDGVLAMSLSGYGYGRHERTRLGVPLTSWLTGDYLGVLRNAWANTRIPAELPSFLVKAFPEWLVLYRRWFRGALASSDHLVTDCPYPAARLAREFRMPRTKFSVIHSGTDTTLFRPDPVRGRLTREKLGLPLDAPVLLMVSVLTRQKGADVALDALRLVLRRRADAFLVVVGGGPEREPLRRRVEAEGLAGRVRLLGPLSNPDLPACYNGADLFVLPTLRVEGFPWVIAEALASGVPVIASAIGGIPSAVDHEITGVLVPPGKAVALAEACLGLLEDTSRRRAMAAAACARALTEFNREVMVERWLGHLSRLASVSEVSR